MGWISWAMGDPGSILGRTIPSVDDDSVRCSRSHRGGHLVLLLLWNDKSIGLTVE